MWRPRRGETPAPLLYWRAWITQFNRQPEGWKGRTLPFDSTEDRSAVDAGTDPDAILRGWLSRRFGRRLEEDYVLGDLSHYRWRGDPDAPTALIYTLAVVPHGPSAVFSYRMSFLELEGNDLRELAKAARDLPPTRFYGIDPGATLPVVRGPGRVPDPRQP